MRFSRIYAKKNILKLPRWIVFRFDFYSMSALWNGINLFRRKAVAVCRGFYFSNKFLKSTKKGERSYVIQQWCENGEKFRKIRVFQ